jgi:dipeptide transport system substrate-binding protein
MKRIALLFAATALAAGLAHAAEAKTLVFCSEGSPEGFDPAPFTAGTTFDASSQPIYNRLVEFVNGKTNVEPGLAERFEVSEDGLEYTFHLRPGVKFHTTGYFTPTRDFNADDVVFSFERQWKEDNPWFNYAGGAWEYFDGMSMPGLLREVRKVDDMTVVFVLKRPEAAMIANLAMDFASIVSKEYADRLLAEGKTELLNTQPVGTGPFQFVDYQKDAVIRYKANPGHWKGKPAIDDLVFAITPDGGVRWQKLKAGDCQIMPYPNPADIAAMKADPNVHVMEQEGLNVGYLAYNTTEPPFDDPKVRKALNMAIDKQAIIDTVYEGAARIARNPIPPAMWGYNQAVVDDPYDPEAARTALAEAGVSGLKMKIWAMPVQRPYNPNAHRIAEMIQADFAKIGVEAEIVSYEWAEYLKRSSEKDRDGAVLLGWTGDNGDPDNFLAVLLGCDAVGGSNRAEWCYPPFEDLILKAKTISDQEARSDLYEEAQAVFKQEAPWATIAHALVRVAMAKSVQGFEVDPFGHFRFDQVDITE